MSYLILRHIGQAYKLSKIKRNIRMQYSPENMPSGHPILEFKAARMRLLEVTVGSVR